MRVTIWAGVLILGCPQLVGGPFDGLAFLAVFVVLALTLAIFMAQRGVGMVCKSMDYNRMRTTGGLK